MPNHENFIDPITKKEYTFVGNPDIECKCLSNGRKCNQRNMQEILDNPWEYVNPGKICTRVWKEVK